MDDAHKQIASLGTIMGIWAHPDDETFTSGGIMAIAGKNGQDVIIVTATKGERGIQDKDRWPPEQLAGIRSKELENALNILGCKQHYWLDYHDSECAADSSERATARISELIDKHKPDTILTFGPDGLTGHSDHQTVSAWVTAVNEGRAAVYHAVEEKEGYEKHMAGTAREFNWYFNTDRPPLKAAAECDIALRLSPEVRQIKIKALQAMPSQYEKFFNKIPKETLENLFVTECFVKAK